MKRKNLNKFLVDHELTQTEVADYLGVTENHFSLLINGKSNPSFGLIEKFEQFCDKRKIIINDMWELWKKE